MGGQSIALRQPKVLDDLDIFSCGMVVDSVSYRTFLTDLADQTMRKAAIIDMESYGFFGAISATKATGVGTVCEGIMVRGVSDYAGRKQQTEQIPGNWKALAVKNAATVAAELVKQIAGPAHIA